MEILAEGAVVANALRTTRSTVYRLSVFAFHHFAALGDQFNLKKYNDQAISYGSPPVKYVRELMGL